MTATLNANGVVFGDATAQNTANNLPANTTNVLNATAAASAGAVGTYVVAWNNSTTSIAIGGTIAGSSLGVATTNFTLNPFTQYDSNGSTIGTALPGTWRAMNRSQGRISGCFYSFYPSLFMRIS